MTKIGFIGVGVMGEPMCRNLVRKSGFQVYACDRNAAPLERLRAHGVENAEAEQLAFFCDVIFLSLPGGAEVEELCFGNVRLCARARPGQMIVDLGTSPVALARRIDKAVAAAGARFADAPIARTRAAAEEGTLSIMVGASEDTFKELRPLLAHMGSDITHCGPVGSGQMVKILNNMVLIETVVALAEALAVARKSGLDGGVLFETLAKGSADSFALRNHGMKALLADVFPERAFSTEYALKDLRYALELAEEAGIAIGGARNAGAALEKAIAAGFGANYWPVIGRIIGE